MELALESYDVCIGLLQNKPKSPDGKHYTINLPNLRVDAAISVEEVCVLASISFFFSFYQYNSSFSFMCDRNLCLKILSCSPEELILQVV